jgi:hypothetical protein
MAGLQTNFRFRLARGANVLTRVATPHGTKTWLMLLRSACSSCRPKNRRKVSSSTRLNLRPACAFGDLLSLFGQHVCEPS